MPSVELFDVVGKWQTYTPNALNSVHIAMDYGVPASPLGANITLNAPVDNTQIVDVPSNMPDGGVLQVNLVGGGGSGNWTQWSSGSPSTPGWYFPGGAAPTADASSAVVTPIYVKRRGAKYVAIVSPTTEAA